jgi:hypothetical protein
MRTFRFRAEVTHGAHAHVSICFYRLKHSVCFGIGDLLKCMPHTLHVFVLLTDSHRLCIQTSSALVDGIAYP